MRLSGDTMKVFGVGWPGWHERCEAPVGLGCLYCDEPIAADDAGVVTRYYPGGLPDEFCVTQPDGNCVSTDPRCMHQPMFGYAVQHRECFLRSFYGSVGHQQHLCSCYGGAGCGDPQNLTPRQAAKAAVAYFEEQHT